MPTTTGGFSCIIWDGTQQKSVISNTYIKKGAIQEEEKIQAKWRGVMYAATVVKTGTCIIINLNM